METKKDLQEKIVEKDMQEDLVILEIAKKLEQ